MSIKEIEGYAVLSNKNKLLDCCGKKALDCWTLNLSILTIETNRSRLIRIRDEDKKNRKLVRTRVIVSEVTDSFNDKKTRASRKRAKK